MYLKNDRKLLCRKIIVMATTIMLGIMIPTTTVFAQTGNISQQIFYPTNDKPYNLTYGQWTAKWWQWLLSIPKDSNPGGDNTGKYCNQGQSGPVWFLTGTYGGPNIRSCTVPAGKAILLPPINTECSYAEYPNLKTESELKTCAKTITDKVSLIEVTVDGVKLQNSEVSRVQSPIFPILFGPGNIYGLKSGNTQGVSDGYWVFLKPLPIGNHEIHSKGVSVDYTTTSTNNFISDVTYHLTV